MLRSRFVLVAVTAAVGTLPVMANAQNTYFALYPSCGSGNSVSLDMAFYNSSGAPVPPEWAGYDVYRRTMPSCAWPGVRVNDEIIARPTTGSHQLFYVDTPSAPSSHQYTVFFVDAQRNPIHVAFDQCFFEEDPLAGFTAYVACPRDLAPITIGEIVSHGGYVEGCDEGCWPDAYGGPDVVGAVVRLYGYMEYCTIEGTLVYFDRFEYTFCGATPATRASWGQLKATYR